MVIWLIGLSGAGKTHIGRALYRRVKSVDPGTVFVDGDEIRQIFGQDQRKDSYSIDGRRKNAQRIRQLCAWLDRQEINVVCCILSIFEESHRWNRETYSQYFEVYISAPMEVLKARNPKNLYHQAENGQIENVVGIDIPFKPPERPDLVVENGDQMVDAERTASEIWNSALRKFRS